MNNINILYCDRIEASEGIDINKKSESKKCKICCYWYFFIKALNFKQTSAANVKTY